MRLTDRVDRWYSVSSLAARVYLGYKAITLREQRLGLGDAAERRARHHAWSARRLYELAVSRQGLLIKFGQLVGSRPDLIPDEYIDILSRLQDQVPSRPYGVIKRAVERELKRPLADVFSHFEREPIAAASLAQVHKATLRDRTSTRSIRTAPGAALGERFWDGRSVAVKVQYPGIEEIVDNDLRNIRVLLRILAVFERNLDFTPLIEEISNNVPQELDFVNEGHNAEMIAANFAEKPDILVPKIIWEYSTRRVLTMEYLDGIKITDLASMEHAGIDRQAVAQLVVDAYCDQLYIHGMFHADPHPGNLFVLPADTEDGGPRLIMLDFGLCRKLDDKFRLGYARLVNAMLTFNLPGIVKAFQELGLKVKNPGDPKTYLELGRSLTDTAQPGRAYADPDLVAEANKRLNRAIKANPITDIPREFLLIGRAMGLLSGLGKHLDSRVDVTATILPYTHAALEGAK
ncbi:MAG: AarF/ABC1/UbiB kinase family protein [Chloroflexi bacterium]|nr:MAG: AarF/ABC1/UbiB kinase family protein [Chloroflexota bacterium]